MKTFNATIKTEYATYYIDLKSNRGMESNPYCVSSPNGAVYLSSLADAMSWIESYDQYLEERAKETA